MSQPEVPFSESEERYLLAEIVKYSAIPPLFLLTLVRDAQTEIQWTELALPYGRSLSACQRAYTALQQRMAADPQNAFYRRFSLDSAEMEQANAKGRELMPRPPSYLPMPGSASSGLIMNNPELPPRKKRGRPNKEEFQRRLAEAHARGEEYPKRRPKSIKASTGPTSRVQTVGSQSAALPQDAGTSPLGPASTPTGGISLGSLLLPTSPVVPLPPPGNSPSVSSGQSRTGYSAGISSPETPSRPVPGSSLGAQTRPVSSEQVPNSQADPSGDQPRPHRTTVSGGPSIPHSQAPSYAPPDNPYGV